VEEALPLAALAELSTEELERRIIPLARCLPGMKRISVDPEQALRLRRGQPLVLTGNGAGPAEPVQVLEEGAHLVAVARMRGDGARKLISPVRVFAREEDTAQAWPAGPKS
jgi:tRNA U55 pseudouridine synthase TruB